MKMKRIIAITMVAAVFLLAAAAQAFNGTWTNLTSGLNWSTAGNWSGGIVATGSTYTANFSTLDITGNTTVHLDGPRVIGNLIFGDIVTNTAAGWILDNNGTAANILTLSNSNPTITVNALGTTNRVLISAVLAGSQGLTKAGPGTLTLSATNTCKGATLVNAGTLRLATQGTGIGGYPVILASTNITVANSGTLSLGNDGGATNPGLGFTSGTILTVQNGGTLNLDKLVTATKTYMQFDSGSTLSGAGNLLISSTNTAAKDAFTFGSFAANDAGGISFRPDQAVNPTITMAFDGTGTGASIKAMTFAAGQNAQLSTGPHTYNLDIADSVSADNDLMIGTLTLTPGTTTEMRVVNKWGAGTVLVTNNLAAAATNFDLNVSTGKMIFGGTANLKSINVSSSGTLQLGNGCTGGSTANDIANAGAVVFNSTGVITNTGVISGSGSLTKSGYGTLILSTNNTYTGSTMVSAGTLRLAPQTAGSQQIPVIIAGTNITVAGGILSVGADGNATNTGIALTSGTQIRVQNGGTMNVDKTLAATRSFAQFDTGSALTGTGQFLLTATNTAGRNNGNVLTIGSVTADDTGGFSFRPDGASNPVVTVAFTGTVSGASIKEMTFTAGQNAQLSKGTHTYNFNIADSAANNDLTIGTLTLSPGTTTQTRVVNKWGAGTLLVTNNMGSGSTNFILNVEDGTMIFGGTANFKSINVSNSGTLRMTAGQIALKSTFLTVSNSGAVDLRGTVQVTNSEFKVAGSAATVTMASLDQSVAANGSFKFVFDSTGIGTINVTNSLQLSKAIIVVDGSVYTGSGGTFTLFDSTNLVSQAASITTAGFDAFQTAYINQDQIDGRDWVQMVVIGYHDDNIPDYIGASGAAQKIVVSADDPMVQNLRIATNASDSGSLHFTNNGTLTVSGNLTLGGGAGGSIVFDGSGHMIVSNGATFNWGTNDETVFKFNMTTNSGLLEVYKGHGTVNWSGSHQIVLDIGYTPSAFTNTFLKVVGGSAITNFLIEHEGRYFDAAVTTNMIGTTNFYILTQQKVAEFRTANELTALLDVFTNSARSYIGSDPMFTVTESFTNSGSLWWINPPFSEEHAFQARLVNTSTDPKKSWDIRIGKSGTVYSMKGSFGEAIPPQWRDPASEYGPYFAPWMDEVFQTVFVVTALNDAPDNRYFHHQAGVYLRDTNDNPDITGRYADANGGGVVPFYSPYLGGIANTNMTGTTNRSYRIVSWPQQAHIPTDYTSDIICYTEYRDVGQGILEVNHVVYNFGVYTQNYMNLPWSGVRDTSFGHHFISKPDGTMQEVFGLQTSDDAVTNYNYTAGWALFCNGTDTGSDTIGIVFGKDYTNNTGGLFYTDWQTKLSTWAYGDCFTDPHIGSPENTWRNMFLGTSIRMIKIKPGQNFRGRYYLVFGGQTEVTNNIATYGLVTNCDYSVYTNAPATVTTMTWYKAAASGMPTTNAPGNGNSIIATRNKPFYKDLPIFVLQNTLDGAITLTTDPYAVTPNAKPYDGTTRYLGFLGYVPPGTTSIDFSSLP